MDLEALELVKAETTALKKLNHPNILQVLESDKGLYTNGRKSKEVNYIALELAEHGELFDIILMSGAFDENLAQVYFGQLLDGIQFCHERGMVHRDLKTENLLLDKNYNLKIADFGFAAPIEGSTGAGEH